MQRLITKQAFNTRKAVTSISARHTLLYTSNRQQHTTFSNNSYLKATSNSNNIITQQHAATTTRTYSEEKKQEQQQQKRTQQEVAQQQPNRRARRSFLHRLLLFLGKICVFAMSCYAFVQFHEQVLDNPRLAMYPFIKTYVTPVAQLFIGTNRFLRTFVATTQIGIDYKLTMMKYKDEYETNDTIRSELYQVCFFV